MNNREPVEPGDRENPGIPRGQEDPHGDVDQWLEQNLGDEERGPVSHVEDEPGSESPAEREPASAPRRAAGTGETEGHLVQLPMGATFGLDHEPSAQEREELVRFAAAADAEMRGQGDRSAGDDEEDAPR